MKYAVISMLFLFGCGHETRSSEDRDLDVPFDEGPPVAVPDATPPDTRPTDCTDEEFSCGDGLVYVCWQNHTEWSYPHTSCMTPQEAYSTTLDHGDCGKCPPQEPCPDVCGEGSAEGRVVCTGNFDKSGPQTICKQGELRDGDYCGPCQEPF